MINFITCTLRATMAHSL